MKKGPHTTHYGAMITSYSKVLRKPNTHTNRNSFKERSVIAYIRTPFHHFYFRKYLEKIMLFILYRSRSMFKIKHIIQSALNKGAERNSCTHSFSKQLI